MGPQDVASGHAFAGSFRIQTSLPRRVSRFLSRKWKWLVWILQACVATPLALVRGGGTAPSGTARIHRPLAREGEHPLTCGFLSFASIFSSCSPRSNKSLRITRRLCSGRVCREWASLSTLLRHHAKLHTHFFVERFLVTPPSATPIAPGRRGSTTAASSGAPSPAGAASSAGFSEAGSSGLDNAGASTAAFALRVGMPVCWCALTRGRPETMGRAMRTHAPEEDRRASGRTRTCHERWSSAKAKQAAHRPPARATRGRRALSGIGGCARTHHTAPVYATPWAGTPTLVCTPA
eukprot:scaffold880_cov384-Prasinococcus_capsulatus_cf.AAC.20